MLSWKQICCLTSSREDCYQHWALCPAGSSSNALLQSCTTIGQSEPPQCLWPETAALTWSDDTRIRQNTTKVLWQRGSDVDGVGQMVEMPLKAAQDAFSLHDHGRAARGFLELVSLVGSSQLFFWDTQLVCRSVGSVGFCCQDPHKNKKKSE